MFTSHNCRDPNAYPVADATDIHIDAAMARAYAIIGVAHTMDSAKKHRAEMPVARIGTRNRLLSESVNTLHPFPFSRMNYCLFSVATKRVDECLL